MALVATLTTDVAEAPPRAATVEAALDRTATADAATPPADTDGTRTGSMSAVALPPLIEPAAPPAGPPRLAPLSGPRLVHLDGGTAADPHLMTPAEIRDTVRSARKPGAVAMGANGLAAAPQDDAPLRSSQTSPADNAVNLGLTPTLKAKVAEPVSGVSYIFRFTVCPGTTSAGSSSCTNDTPIAAQSAWTTGSWTVPAGKLKANSTYSWSVEVSEGQPGATSAWGTWFNDVRVFATGATLSAPDSDTPVLVSPADAAVLTTRTPVLTASISRPVPGATYQYQFTITSYDGAMTWNSSWQASRTITVPATTLYWNRGYTWSVAIRDNPYMGTIFNPERTFYPIVPVPAQAKVVADRRAPYDHGVSVGSGAFTSESIDAAVAVAGGSLAISRSYRSVDTAVRALGAGWTSVFDMSVSTPSGGAGPVVQFADGHVEGFAANPDGSFAGAPGNLGTTLTKCSTCTAYTVSDGQGSTFTLDNLGLLSVKNQSGNVVNVTRDATTKKPTQLKDAKSGRTLTVTWSGAHITKIAAGPAPSGVVSEWNYTYSGDRLTKACAPGLGTVVRCTTYAYANATYPNAITSVGDPSGAVRATVTYGSGAVAASVADAAGTRWTFARSAVTGGTKVTSTGPGAVATTYTIDADSRVTRQVDALGGAQTWTYDSAGRLARYQDAAGGGLTLAYSPEGFIASRSVWQTPTTYTTQCFTYYKAAGVTYGKLKSVQDPRGWWCGDNVYVSGTDMTSYEYDAAGRLTAEVQGSLTASPAAPRQVYAYTTGTETAVGGGTVPAGLLAKVTTPGGGAVQYAYASSGQVRTVTTPAGLATGYTYDTLGRTATISSVAGGTTSTSTFGWFDDGVVRSTTGPAVADSVSGVPRQVRTETVLDAGGRPSEQRTSDLRSGAVSTVATSYDTLGRVVKVVGPDGSRQAAYTYDALGNVTSSTDARGAVVSSTFDALGRPLTSTLMGYRDPLDKAAAPRDVRLATATYDAVGRLATATDAAGQVRRYAYRLDGRLTSVTAVGANGGRDVIEQAYAYDALGNVTSVSTANGLSTTSYTYDALGRLSRESTGPRVTTYTRDAAGRVTRQSVGDATGVLSYTRTEYDTAGRAVLVASGRTADERVTRHAYDEAGRLTATTDQRGSAVGDPAWSTTYTYDATGQVTSVAEPLTAVTDASGTRSSRPTTRFGYDAFGRQSVVVDQTGARTTVAYDAGGRVASVTAPRVTLADGSVTTPTVTRAYDAAGDLTSETDAAGRVTSHTYDVLGRAATTTEPPATAGGTPRVSTWTWSDAGDVTAMTDPTGRKATWAYDKRGLRTSATSWDGTTAYTTTFAYDDAGRATAVTDPLGAVTRLGYDTFGNLTSATDADSVAVTVGYDALGRQTRIASGGQTAVVEYDGVGNPVKKTRLGAGDAVIETTTATYDPAGNQLTASGPLGTGGAWTWDAAGRMRSQATAVGATTTLSYDAAGDLTRIVDPRGHATDITRDALGRPTTVVEPPTAAHPALADRTWTTSFDVVGNAVTAVEPGGVRTTRTFDADGRVLTEAGSGGGAQPAERTYEYDASGRITGASHPDGVQRFTYDGRGLLIAASGPAGDTTTTYDAAGRAVAGADASGAYSATWTRAGRLSSATVDGLRRTYAYTSAGLPLSETYADGTSRSFSYDAAGRLTSDTVGSTYTWSGTYDAAGRLATKTVGPATTADAGTTTYAYDAASQLTGWVDPDGTQHTQTLDRAGNVVARDGVTSTYDERNRLLADGASTFEWSPRGTRSSVTTEGETTRSTFDAFGQLTSDATTQYSYDALGRIATAGTQAFQYAGLAKEPSTAGEHSYGRVGGALLAVDGRPTVQNGHGDVVATLGDGGVLNQSTGYTPWGLPTGERAAGGLGYQGQWTAQSGLVHMQSRWYDPTTGSFVTRDAAQVPLDQANRYAYAAGNPVGNSDPTGQFVPGFAAVAAISQGVAQASAVLAAAAAVTTAAVVVAVVVVVVVVVVAGVAIYQHSQETPTTTAPQAPSVTPATGPGRSPQEGPSPGRSPGFTAPSVPEFDFSGLGSFAPEINMGPALQGLTQTTTALTDMNAGIGQMNTGIAGANQGLGQANQGLGQMNQGLGQMNSGLTQANQGLSQMNSGLSQANQGLSQMNSGLSQANQGLSQMNQAISQIGRAIDDMVRALAEMNAALQGILAALPSSNWANEPDHSESLTTRPEIANPVGVLPVDAARLCEVSLLICRAAAGDTAADMTTPVDLSTSFVPTASVPGAPGAAGQPPQTGAEDGTVRRNASGRAIDDRGRFIVDPETGPAPQVSRPYIRQWVRDEVLERAPRDGKGRLIDENDQQPIEGPFHFGHTYGNEWWRVRDKSIEQGWSRDQLNDYVNDPNLFQIERPENNWSHRYEMP
ncbi:GH-E family nuclease [Cellulomonas fengjieae]|uniref:GH-E family nuclease n=1 Tax=Cellulomonas fengjieae TaxID=2819978 RepID=UPI001AB018DE|nr:GH-E family nuclease [Cellulomonas fengjieae]MBO3103419.1 hypothetical protein [Cellulomonas fengjieae]